MHDKYYQRIAKEDNCSYIFDYARKIWQRICDIDTQDVPMSVIDSVKEDIESVKEDIEKGQSELNLLKSINI